MDAMDKEHFLKEKYANLLKQLKGDELGQWGVLSAQGMVEHMSDAIGEAWGRIPRSLQTPPEALEKAKSFAMSDREFRPGTKNSLMPDTAPPLRHPDMAAAIHEIEQELIHFMDYYRAHPHATITNPFFGDLNYQEWLQLLHKHAMHHLKQFNLV